MIPVVRERRGAALNQEAASSLTVREKPRMLALICMSDHTPSPAAPEASTPLFPRLEEEVQRHWQEEQVFARSVSERPAEKTFVFYDGPPFATGLPHYGHLLQSTIKDAVPRYWTMQGYRVPRRWGWDCHGLPIENLIEKELKLGSRKEIEAHGLDRFNAACRATVFTYEHEWGKYIERLGRWVEFQDSYKTMDNAFMESVWWAFSELYKKELIYKGFRVSLFCPRCSTPVSNFEIAMGNSYIEREDPAIYLKFAVEGRENTFFIAWTTTPWSIPGVTGLAVSADVEYVAARHRETGETIICAEARLGTVTGELLSQYEIVERFKGTDLVGMHYRPLYSFLPLEGDPHRVILGAHVTTDMGTGIVTTAPAFGEEDLRAGEDAGLPIAMTLDDEGRFVDACTLFAGVSAKAADEAVIADLTTKGQIWRRESIKHSVAICWRCDTLLLYKAQPAWFVNVTKLKPQMLKTADKINWHPDHFKEGRFGKGLNTAPDWNISRTRYWGSPLPVWECEKCEERTVIGSIEELKTKAIPSSFPEELDLHRPVIDNVFLPCACGGTQKRIPEVFDCWFESGSMPYASVHYPFENKKWFETHFPADFIGEAQDQTRGWFYTLHVLATGLFDKPAFKDVIVTGMVLAEDGKKMSKKLKNYPDPWHVLTTYGADALRYYLLSSPVVEAESLNFSEKDLQTVVRGFENLLWNIKTFYETYSQGVDVALTKPRSMHVLDRWLFSRFHALVRDVTEAMDHYQLSRATRPLRGFVEDLSTWWLRRSRERMKSENSFDRVDALRTLREILEETSKLIAPFMPFLSEKMYQDLSGSKVSVHLERWPKTEERLIDTRLLADMETVRALVSEGLETRVRVKIPVRQALARLTVRWRDTAEFERWSKQEDLFVLVREELNVEEIAMAVAPEQETAWALELDTELTPALKRKGLLRELTRQVMSLRKEAKTQPADEIEVQIVTTEMELQSLIQEEQELLKKELHAQAFALVENVSSEVVVQKTAALQGMSCTIAITRIKSK